MTYPSPGQTAPDSLQSIAPNLCAPFFCCLPHFWGGGGDYSNSPTASGCSAGLEVSEAECVEAARRFIPKSETLLAELHKPATYSYSAAANSYVLGIGGNPSLAKYFDFDSNGPLYTASGCPNGQVPCRLTCWLLVVPYMPTP